MHDIDLTAKVKNIIRFALPTLILVAAIIGCAEFRYWHRNETVHLDNAKVSGTMVSVRALTNGKVKEVLFEDGAQVQAGDVIARLEVSITDEEIKQLENTVQLAKNRYAELQGGQMVKVAVQRERVTYKQVEKPAGGGGGGGTPSGDLAKLEERANRMEELFEMGAVSAVQRDAARRAYENARAGNSPASTTQTTSEPVVEYYTEYVDEFRPTPPEVLEGAEQAIKQAELSLNVARQEARETDVIAPVSGAIYYGVESETNLSAGDFVARIGDSRELWVEAEVTEDIFDRISLGKFAVVTIDGKEYFGTVTEKIKPNVTEATDDDENAEEPMELPEIPDTTNKPAPTIGENPSPQPENSSTTPEQPKPEENSATTTTQAPPEENPENQAAQSTEPQPTENQQTPENPTPAENQTTTPENSSNEKQPPETPKLPKIPAAETQQKPNDKFIVKISLPVERDIEFKPGTIAVVEIKI